MRRRPSHRAPSVPVGLFALRARDRNPTRAEMPQRVAIPECDVQNPDEPSASLDTPAPDPKRHASIRVPGWLKGSTDGRKTVAGERWPSVAVPDWLQVSTSSGDLTSAVQDNHKQASSAEHPPPTPSWLHNAYSSVVLHHTATGAPSCDDGRGTSISEIEGEGAQMPSTPTWLHDAQSQQQRRRQQQRHWPGQEQDTQRKQGLTWFDELFGANGRLSCCGARS